MLASNPGAKPAAKMAGSNQSSPLLFETSWLQSVKRRGLGQSPRRKAPLSRIYTSFVFVPMRSGLRSSVRVVIYSSTTADKSFFVPGFDIHNNGLVKAKNGISRLPVLGRSYLCRRRLTVSLFLGEYPPSRFGQMTR